MEKTVVILSVGLFLGGGFVVIASSFYRRVVLWWRFRRGKLKEDEMTRYLKKKGYEILSSQPSFRLKMYVNDEVLSYHVKPDLIVRQNLHIFAVEIKSGKVAPNPLYRATRRQLMEYYFGLECDGILLVNAETKEISSIRFNSSSKSYSIKKVNRKKKILLLTLFITVLIVFLIYLYYM
jgi:hypothetical protein